MNTEEIFFRASSIGNLMTEGQGKVFTENMQIELDNLYYELENGVNRNGNKVKWTDNKDLRLKDLVAKRDAPPELSPTAKSEVEKIWLLNEKGFFEDLENKYLSKGLLNENEGLQLVGDVLGDFLIKNSERKYQNNVTGEADAFSNATGKKIVIDIKCSWNAKTFMNNKLSSLYEYQLRTYMMLYDVEEAWLCYALTDTPDHLIEQEKKKLYYKYYSNSMTNEEIQLLDEKLQDLYKQVEMNMTYSNNPAYSKEEMVKIFKITRDRDLELKLLEKVQMGLEYYKTIKLNQIKSE